MRGYTLLEILVAVTLMLMIMLGLTQLFSSVGTQVNNTQATLRLAGDLRSVKTRLESDLKMVTADLTKAPPMKTGLNQGYFCIIEGMGAAYSNARLQAQDYVGIEEIAYSEDSRDNDNYDNTVGDMDDILMFTAHAPAGQPFRGLINGQVRESSMAEIIWFCRGNTLYRRTLLIVPQDTVIDPNQQNDVSVRAEGTSIVPNSLEDLALRQNRFGHFGRPNDYPFNIHRNSAVYYMRMPTIQEMSLPDWNFFESFTWNIAQYTNNNPVNPLLIHTGKNVFSDNLPDGNEPFIDFWEEPFPWKTDNSDYEIDQFTGNLVVRDQANWQGKRYAEDVILTNVISFNIQVWDDVARRYVSLGDARWDSSNNRYAYPGDGTPAGPLGQQGNYRLLGVGRPDNNRFALPCVYDTWSTEYARDGYPLPSGMPYPEPHLPPYDVPLRGVKITIRAFDPLSKHIREMTVVHSFAGK